MTELADEQSANGAPALSHAEIGERIAAILNAAEASAEQIRAHARDEAAAILHQAHETAAWRIADLTREPERLRDEAAADALATRSAADEYAAEQRHRADQEARELVARAEAEARRVAEESRGREEAAAARIRSLNEVRDDAAAAVLAAVSGLRETAVRVEAEVMPFVDPEALDRRGSRSWSRLLRRDQPASSADEDETDALAPSDDLYQRAKALGIRGRSKMSRNELESAVTQASVEGE
jgi:hypothetical protein